MKALAPTPVKYFVGILFSQEETLDTALRCMAEKLGPLGLRSADFPFEVTDYYNAEMGSPIQRTFVELTALRDPGELPTLKQLTNEVEAVLAVDGRRKVNLDVGYLDLHKMILASAKYNGQKVYLGEGIYADVTLIYEHKAWHAVENTFPDFKSGDYTAFFDAIRQRYKAQLKSSAH